MNWRRITLGICFVLIIPIAINYGLLSWRGPGVHGSTGEWLGFFANFLGVLGAVLIALFQFRKQRELDEQREIENNRSYVDIQEFRATMMLVGVKTHENSRIISTNEFEKLKNKLHTEEYKSYQVPYLKISHYGIAPVITDCHIQLKVSFVMNDSEQIETYDFFVGAMEKDIELFIPLIPPGGKANGTTAVKEYVKFDYVSLRGEQLTLIVDYKSNTEVLYTNRDSKQDLIYKSALKSVNWVFPNKIDHISLKTNKPEKKDV
ncbi:hypothetical protein JJQ72_06200 [Paenibacillus sp. F411]|uniref:hypothetical protein n=1 Tax=Paenibacillus sp. F411 TaxID=2820239 RepID=UPI001AAEA3D4|nr:hypothetical protein [Paenibacillus sp. F411]MBO2943568.1 hypothetical protein [Paenibacillus sp. F411]